MNGASDEKGHMFLNLQDKGLLLRIDVQALKVLDTWNVAPCGQPSAMDMDKEHDRIFIGCRSGVFAAVDGNSGRVIRTMPIGPGVDALEFDAAKGLIYVSSGGDDEQTARGDALSEFPCLARDTVRSRVVGEHRDSGQSRVTSHTVRVQHQRCCCKWAMLPVRITAARPRFAASGIAMGS
jgi:hypothetical protein